MHDLGIEQDQSAAATLEDLVGRLSCTFEEMATTFEAERYQELGALMVSDNTLVMWNPAIFDPFILVG